MAVSRNNDGRWWIDDYQFDRARRITGIAQQVYKQLAPVRHQMLYYGALYDGLSHRPTPTQYRRQANIGRTPLLCMNVCKSVSDTWVSLVTKDEPKTSVVTTNETADIQRKARTCERFLEGTNQQAGFQGLLRELAFDACKFGQGILRPEVVVGNPKKPPTLGLARCLPWDVLVADTEGLFRKPRTLYQLSRVDRYHLASKFPEYESRIETIASTDFDQTMYEDSTADTVTVIEAWHTADWEGGTGGRYSSVVGDILLEDVEYNHTFMPHCWLYWQLPTFGVYARSLCHDIAGIQLAINRLFSTLTKAQALVVGHWMVEIGSKVNFAALNDQLGSKVDYEGTMPVFNAPTPVDPSMAQHLLFLITQAYSMVGISQMSAQSLKPAGIDSGEAIRTYADVTTQRFEPCYRLLQDFTLDVSRVELAFARDIAEDHPGYEVKAMGKQGMAVIKASDALLSDNEFGIELQATNALADELPARIQQINDLAAMGGFTTTTVRRLVSDGNADLEAELALEDSSRNLVMKCLDAILNGEEYEPPDPGMQFADLPDGTPGAIRLSQLVALKAQNDGADEERVAMLYRWAAQAVGLKQLAAPPMVSGPGGSPMPPPGAVPGGAPVPAPPQQGQAA
jgi:hypothetical protein